eukprot:CAMPEP_0206422766 /NCGR_PEP_ID=MMETSP0324_2-20121206/2287_1 /ASSEMBLY_ACC=CAM_ASM_000836 /TAXON_ID=2866 /ORGANISM="Crypthecodinium cohnii, Strain Seligo" /LENGTH=119 /DNA_ID=CAMNT_0053887211 /DNA_START=57 /DNA_END=417 /DNA_ORIENTATION=-
MEEQPQQQKEGGKPREALSFICMVPPGLLLRPLLLRGVWMAKQSDPDLGGEELVYPAPESSAAVLEDTHLDSGRHSPQIDLALAAELSSDGAFSWSTLQGRQGHLSSFEGGIAESIPMI